MTFPLLISVFSLARCDNKTNGSDPLSRVERESTKSSKQPITLKRSATLMVASDVQWGGWGPTVIYEKTAQVIEKENPDRVIVAGDISNAQGSAWDYQQLDKAWGRFKDKILVVPGNHDYATVGANPFFDYFNGFGSTKGVPTPGTHTGERGKGYFAIDVAEWTIIGLNWFADSSRSYQENDAQMQWLEATMKKKPSGRPVLFFSHAPRYTKASGHKENQGNISIAWNIMQKFGFDAKIFVGGHLNGVYERWKPMNNDKKYSAHGIRSFLVATGGASPYNPGPVDDLLESTSKAYGAMKLVLRPDGYDWEFKGVPGSSFTDKGSFDFAPAIGQPKH